MFFQDFLYKFPLGVQNIKFIFFKIAQDNIIAGENIKIKRRPEDVIFCFGSHIRGAVQPVKLNKINDMIKDGVTRAGA